MLYLYGDSHAQSSFKGLLIDHKDCHTVSITMHRVGRDNVLLNKKNHTHADIICVAFGEVDCRCHVQKQINMGRDEDEIIHDLVIPYFNTIKNNITQFKKIIIVGIIPPTKQIDYESLYGPITHEFPFVGSDSDRVRYTNKINTSIEKMCSLYNYIYFNPYSYYTREDGTLKHELSDTTVHIGDTTHFINEFTKLYDDISK